MRATHAIDNTYKLISFISTTCYLLYKLLSDQDFIKVFNSNILSAIHGFRDNEVLLQTGYDVIVISPPKGDSRDLSWRILKDRPGFHDSDP